MSRVRNLNINSTAYDGSGKAINTTQGVVGSGVDRVNRNISNDSIWKENRLWTPAQITTALWLDAYDSGTLTGVSGAVSQWDDKSGNKRHFSQATPANRPAIDSVFNPQSILWDGTTDNLQTPNGSWAYAYPMSFFCLVRANAWSVQYNGLAGFYSGNTGATAGWGYWVKSNGKTAVYIVDSTGAQPGYDGTGTATLATNSTHILGMTIANGSITSWANGLADGTTTGAWTARTSPLGTNLLEVGSDTYFSRRTNWRIFEAIAISNTTLTDNIRQKIEGYMAWRASRLGDQTALNNLPISHPYKNRPPLIGD